MLMCDEMCKTNIRMLIPILSLKTHLNDNDNPTKLNYFDLLDHLRIELFVPRTEERISDIHPLSIQTQLDHLWTSTKWLAFHAGQIGLGLQRLTKLGYEVNEQMFDKVFAYDVFQQFCLVQYHIIAAVDEHLGYLIRYISHHYFKK